MDRETKKEMTEKYIGISDKIFSERIKQTQSHFERSSQWISSIEMISFGLGGAIVPLALSNASLSKYTLLMIGIATLILLVNGFMAIFLQKNGIEKDGRIVNELGYLHEAVMQERITAFLKHENGEINDADLEKVIEDGGRELDMLGKNISETSNEYSVSYWLDLHLWLLTLGICFILSSIIPLPLIFYFWISIGIFTLFYLILIRRSEILLNETYGRKKALKIRAAKTEAER